MALGGGMSCVKYLMFLFNLLFALTGLVILGVGAYVQHKVAHFVEWLDIGFVSSPIILIIVGVFIFVVAFFGCCGAIKENHCMIMTFSALLVLIFAVEAGVGIAGYIQHGQLENILAKRLNDSIPKYNQTDVKIAFNMLQTELNCCGAEKGPQDWGTHIPDSCCSALKIENNVTEACSITNEHLHNDPCLPALLQYLQGKAMMLGGVGIGIAAVQLLGVIFACCLARSIRQEYETV